MKQKPQIKRDLLLFAPLYCVISFAEYVNGNNLERHIQNHSKERNAWRGEGGDKRAKQNLCI